MTPLPFAAIGGSPQLRRALLATLVDPMLAGAILRGSDRAASEYLDSFLAFAVEQGLLESQRRIPVNVDFEALDGVEQGFGLLGGHRRPGLLPETPGHALRLDATELVDETLRGRLKQQFDQTGRVGPSYAIRPAGAEPPPSWLDAIPFILDFVHERDAEKLRLRMCAGFDSGRLRADYAAAELRLAEELRQARVRLAGIEFSEASIRHLLLTSPAELVGPRSEIAALRAARAHCALRAGDVVTSEDLDFAYCCVLWPRLLEHERPAEARPKPSENLHDEASETKEPVTAKSGPSERPSEADGQGAGSEDKAAASSKQDALPDRAEDALEHEWTPPLIAAHPAADGVASQGAGEVRIDLERGAPAGLLPASKPGRRLALSATLRQALLRGARRRPEGGIEFRGSDLRFRRYRRRRGRLILVAVDASGSMGLGRLREAKGAVIRLLAQAYRQREEVALIAMRGEGAQLLLPPTSALARARRELQSLPAGGGTPLLHGLLELHRLHASEKAKGGREVLALLISDGRGNLPLGSLPEGTNSVQRRAIVRAEIADFGPRYARSGPSTLVVDTSRAGDALWLAELIAASHVRMPRSLDSLLRRERSV